MRIINILVIIILKTNEYKWELTFEFFPNCLLGGSLFRSRKHRVMTTFLPKGRRTTRLALDTIVSLAHDDFPDGAPLKETAGTQLIHNYGIGIKSRLAEWTAMVRKISRKAKKSEIKTILKERAPLKETAGTQLIHNKGIGIKSRLTEWTAMVFWKLNDFSENQTSGIAMRIVRTYPDPNMKNWRKVINRKLLNPKLELNSLILN